MGEYEPDDSRNVTLTPNEAPGEPPRTGPREGEARAKAADTPEQRHQTAFDEADRAGLEGGVFEGGATQPGQPPRERSAVDPDEDSVPIGK